MMSNAHKVLDITERQEYNKMQVCACLKAFRAHVLPTNIDTWIMCSKEPSTNTMWGSSSADMSYMHTANGKLKLGPRLRFSSFARVRAYVTRSFQPPNIGYRKAYIWHHVYTWWFTDDQLSTYTHKIRTFIKLNLFVSICRTQHNATSTAQQFHLINAGAVGTFMSVDPVHPDAYSLNQHLQHGYRYIYTFICVYIYVYCCTMLYGIYVYQW